MNPLRWSFRALMLLGACVCLALVGFAFYTQLAWGLEPCALCVRQRMAYLALAGVFVVAGLWAPTNAGGRKALGLLTACVAFAGAGVAGYQIWLKFFPPQMPVCKFQFMDLEPSLWQRFSTPTVECGASDWAFLGLSMPVWSLVWFLLLAAVALFAGLRTRR